MCVCIVNYQAGKREVILITVPRMTSLTGVSRVVCKAFYLVAIIRE